MQPETLLFYDSPKKNGVSALLLFAISAALVAALVVSCLGHAVPISALQAVTFSLAALLSGCASFAFARRARNSAPSIILDGNGIFSRNAPYGLIPWSEISSASIS